MVSPPEIEKIRSTYSDLFDASLSRADDHLDLRSEALPRFPALVVLLRRKLREPGTSAVEVRLDGAVLGISTEEKVAVYTGTAAGVEAVPVSSGDRASLEGDSTQYQALIYRCTILDCAYSAFRSFHDARLVPVCPDDGRLMELSGWT